MIWFDIDNSPHVPLFRPILAELDRRGIEYLVTARNFAQTIDLLKYWNMPHYPVGIHGGRVKIKKQKLAT
jgi:predicted glycosyltransferase